MFVFIKNSIKRCTALTTGPTFLSLSREFKTCFQNYAESLRGRCPPLSGQPLICKVIFYTNIYIYIFIIIFLKSFLLNFF